MNEHGLVASPFTPQIRDYDIPYGLNALTNLKTYDGIPRDLWEHKLNIYPRTFPIQQKKRILAKERNEAITQEVSKLVKACILREVLIICYPLPEIDQEIESLEGFKFKCFIDAYKGYQKIQMAHEHEEKSLFHVEHGTLCYEKMPFGLKKASATYRGIVDKAFTSQICRNLEIYVDYMVVKTKTEGSLLTDVEETCNTLRRINIKLTPKKYEFGVKTCQFLGHMITKEGIETNPKNVKAIIDMVLPRTIQEVQSVNEKVAADNALIIYIYSIISRELSVLNQVYLLLYILVLLCLFGHYMIFDMERLDMCLLNDDGKTTGVLPNKESKTVNQEPQSKTDLEKSITKFLDGQRVTNMFFKNNVNDMILKMKQNEKNFQTKIKNMDRKIDEWSKSQNVSLEQTNRTKLPHPPQAHTEHVNVIFTGSGNSDYSLKILKDPPPPIIVNNKIKKDKP
nr:reverse transcriptase domain-containing protein [Tanacetum cinerariifolium]